MVRIGRSLLRSALALAFFAGSTGCSGGEPLPEGPGIDMRFAATDSFWASPVPSLHRVDADGLTDLDAFPLQGRNPFVDALIGVARETSGAGRTSPIYLRAEAALDPASLPGLDESTEEGASVALIDIDAASPEVGRRMPIEVMFMADGGPWGDVDQLVALPYQGIPLAAARRYALVVTDGVRLADGGELGVSAGMRALIEGDVPSGLAGDAAAAYADALDTLDDLGIARRSVRGLAVFETGDPVAQLVRARETFLESGSPSFTTFEAQEVFDDFCVYEAQVDVPTYQAGTPPFTNEGGGFRFDEEGHPIRQGTETARVVVTLPRAAMPEDGYPLTFFVRTGGGGDRPLVDRGFRPVAGGPAGTPGTGPALHLARAGVAGLSPDGPHGGIRNITAGDEQFLIFNIGNPEAMLGNIRQSALELVWLVSGVETIRIDVSGCPGASAPSEGARFDPDRIALMGHSMGATISPLAAAIEPRFRAVVLSGAGGSWIDNILHKENPLRVRPVAELILGYSGARTLERPDPTLFLLQWAGDAADPPVFAPHLAHDPILGAAPRDVLMFQGITDTYILPPIANALSLAAGLDLAGEGLEARDPESARFTALAPLLPLSGGAVVPYPASANVGDGDAARTAVVAQHLEGPIEDGHEVMFQTDGPKAQYECFFRAFARGARPVVIDPEASCPTD